MKQKKIIKWNPIYVGAVLLVIAVAINVVVWLYPFTYQIGLVSDDVWASSQVFDLDYTIPLQKDPAKDFIVLNLADVQLTNYRLWNGDYRKTRALLTQLIDEVQPDLITLTGDNFAGAKNYMAMRQFLPFLDSFGIPWAFALGNHDDDGDGDNNWAADTFMQYENCIAKKGPATLGTGNYIISIMERDEIVQAIFMMDSHDDEISDIQQEWYAWATNGLNAVAGHTVDSTIMFHIPLTEYNDAWDYWVSTNYDANIGFGEKNETVCSADISNGFFTLISSLGSTKNVICGHDHTNNYSIVYNGVRLTYGVKSSYCSYHNDNLGGTVLKISGTDATIEQHICKL